jgi:hypothetical protein
MTPARRQRRALRAPRPMSPERKSESKERLGYSSFMGEVDRKKQASGTRASTEPKDVDPTSSPSTVKSGARHSEKRCLQGGYDVQRQRHHPTPAKPDLGFHPGVIDGWESGLHGNASKEENDALKRRPLSAPTRSDKIFIRRPTTTTSTGPAPSTARAIRRA